MLFDPTSVTAGHPATFVVGHRGAAGLRPENTLPGFAVAVELQVAAVELDVHCVEGELVVIHDDTLERTTDGAGAVAACTLSRLRTFDAGAGARVPLLHEVFELLPHTLGINVELKGAGTAEPLAGFLGDYSGHDVLVSSFDHAALRDFHRSRGEVPVAPLFHRWRRDVWTVADGLNAWSVNLSARIATPQRITEAHRRGYRVLVYTVNEVPLARELAACGVDGLFTDYPDRITPAALSDSAPG